MDAYMHTHVHGVALLVRCLGNSTNEVIHVSTCFLPSGHHLKMYQIYCNEESDL